MKLVCLSSLLILVHLTGCAERPAESLVTLATVPSSDGVPISYEVRGTGDPTLLLVPGWTNSREVYGQHPTTLSQTNRVVTVELAGHGDSGDQRHQWTMEAFAADVIAVADHLQLDRIVLVGFSMGGGVVLEAAEHLGDRVLGVVFIDTFKNPDRRMSDEQIQQMITTFRSAWGDTAFLRAFAFTPDAPDSLIVQLANRLPAEPEEHWFDMLPGIQRWMATEFEPTIRSLNVPVAAINSSHTPTDVEAMRRYVPSFTVDTMGSVGHAGVLLRKVDEFDAKLLALVDRFAAERDAVSPPE